MAFTQVARTAGRNGRRPVEQRLSRWMLVAHHGSEGDELPMTGEFLSLMLGARRAGVTVAAGALQKAGLVRYGNGRMAITDRPGLEATACACYGPVRRDFERLLGPVAGSWYRRRAPRADGMDSDRQASAEPLRADEV